jgi:hypothetical protein
VLAKTADQLHDLQRTVLRLQTERDELLSSVHSARGAQDAAPVCGLFWKARLAVEGLVTAVRTQRRNVIRL